MPVLSIEIPWGPDLVEVGGVLLTWHGVFTAIGIIAGVMLSLRMGRAVGYDPDQALNLALVGVPAGIIGARALFVAERWDFYGENPGEILALNEGGISVWGAVLGGVIGAWLFALWRRYPVRRGLDIAAFGLILGMAIGRVGDLVNGEHLGRPTDLPWGVVYTDPDSPAFAHSYAAGPHHPATTYELLGDLAILGVLFVLMLRVWRDRPGLTFFAFLVLYSVMRFFVTYLRLDSEEVSWAGGLRTPQVVSLAVLAVALPCMAWLWTRPREAPPAASSAAPPPPSRPGAGSVAVRRRR